MLEKALPASAEAAATTMELERKAIAVLVEAMIGLYLVSIAAAGRSGVQEVYGVLYLDVGCDVCFGVALAHQPVNTFTTTCRHAQSTAKGGDHDILCPGPRGALDGALKRDSGEH